MALKRNHWIWIGPLLAFGAAVSYFLFFVRFPVLRDFPWLNLPLVVLGGLISLYGVWTAWKRRPEHRGWRFKIVLATLGFLFAAGLVHLFSWYIFSYSYQIPEAPSLAGKAAPAFSLTDDEGNTVQLSDYRGKKVLLVFYRGYW